MSDAAINTRHGRPAQPAIADDGARPAPRRAASQRKRHGFWRGLWAAANSSFGLWVLSSIALSGGVYLFQNLADSRQQQRQTAQQVDMLNLEIAGRLAQFGQWANANLLVRDGSGFGFRKTASAADIEKAIAAFADRPRETRAAGEPYIEEVYPDFAKRDLISLYAELNAINNTRLAAACPARACGDAEALSDARLQLLKLQAEYKSAMVAILDPDYLLRYRAAPDHTVFIRSFEGIFLTPEIRRSGLPYTDALEHCGDGGCRQTL